MTSPIVLVTGCSKSGIGFALCERFASKGCKVYATARNVDKMQGLSAGIELLALDVLKDDDVQAVVTQIIQREGRVDVLVNNVGALCIGPVLDQPLDRLKDAFETNTFSAIRVAKAVFPGMANRESGMIINIGSIAGQVTTPWNGAYCAAKAALHTLTDALDMECRPFNIHVLLVATGGIRSNIAQNAATSLILPEDSFYKAFIPNMITRMNASQTPRSMPTDEFAERVVNAALSNNPPKYLSVGENATLFALLRWLPRALVLLLMWRRFSKPAQ